MSIFAFELRNSYCVAKTLCSYLKISDPVHPSSYFLRNNIFCFVSRNSSELSATKTNVEVSSDVECERPDSEKLKRKPSREVLDYMLSNESLNSTLGYLPVNILKRRKTFKEPIYIVDKEVAGEIINEIENVGGIKRKNVPTFEINPGVGILSKELLLAGVHSLHMCEPSNFFYRQMQLLVTDFPAQVQHIQQDLLSLYNLAYRDKHDGGSRVEQLFSKVSKGKWTDDPVMIIIGILPSISFMRYLIYSHIHQTGIFLYGRPELYVIMSPSTYFYLTSGKNDGYFYYRSLSVLFQLIFQWNVLKKLPRKAFLPWEMKYTPKKWSKLTKVQNIDPEYLYLVKIVPHQDFFERIVKEEQLHQLWYFIWHHMVSRKNRVIEQLEKWIPGCGPRLIACDFTIHTEFGDLTPHQILSLFYEFTSWPEYSDCPFLSSMENILMMMEQTGDEMPRFVNRGEVVTEDENDAESECRHDTEDEIIHK